MIRSVVPLWPPSYLRKGVRVNHKNASKQPRIAEFSGNRADNREVSARAPGPNATYAWRTTRTQSWRDSMAVDHRANDERTNLTSSNKFELLLYRLGSVPGSDAHELYGINVFKVREISTMPPVTPIAGSSPFVMGAVDIRGQIIPVIDLPRLMGCEPTRGLNILLVTEFARSTQAFAVEEVDDIVRLEWNQVLSAEGAAGGNLVTSIARIDGNTGDSRLAQVIDVEQVLRDVFPSQHPSVDPASVGEALGIPRGAKILAADDSGFARKLIEQAL